jgi:hypothetical protein
MSGNQCPLTSHLVLGCSVKNTGNRYTIIMDGNFHCSMDNINDKSGGAPKDLRATPPVLSM